MNKNLIISAALGYNFQQIEFFIKSLRKYYSGDICFVIGKKDLDLEKGLKNYNCDIIKTNINKKKIQFERYEIFSKYLENKNYNNILLCDSRDIYFQGNPFEFNYNGPINFFLEDYQIKNCPYNSNWIIKTYGKKEYEKISNKILIIGDLNLNGSISIVGLVTTESVAIEIPRVASPDIDTDADWTAIVYDGETFQLDVDNNRRSIPFRGTYRISKPVSTGNAFGIGFCRKALP